MAWDNVSLASYGSVVVNVDATAKTTSFAANAGAVASEQSASATTIRERNGDFMTASRQLNDDAYLVRPADVMRGDEMSWTDLRERRNDGIVAERTDRTGDFLR